MSELDRLYDELRNAQSMSEDAVCLTFNVDSKQEYIEILNEEIDRLEDEINDVFQSEDDDDSIEVERERTSLCISQGISRYC